QGKFNSPYGSYTKPKICDAENILQVHSVLNYKNVVLLNSDFDKLRSKIQKKSFVYLDPPYKPISKTSNFTSYSAEAFDDEAQIRLANLLKFIDTKKAIFMLSNSEPKNENPDDTFFDDIYQGFSVRNVYASRMINSKADKRGKIKEIVVTNYKV
ncbi:MAG: Dam family site-specific DNA-(adenine-N6)-methyltransferase, partial [Spirochaetota bacterium]